MRAEWNMLSKTCTLACMWTFSLQEHWHVYYKNPCRFYLQEWSIFIIKNTFIVIWSHVMVSKDCWLSVVKNFVAINTNNLILGQHSTIMVITSLQAACTNVWWVTLKLRLNCFVFHSSVVIRPDCKSKGSPLLIDHNDANHLCKGCVAFMIILAAQIWSLEPCGWSF